jgi:hypothetical protein
MVGLHFFPEIDVGMIHEPCKSNSLEPIEAPISSINYILAEDPMICKHTSKENIITC